MPKQSVQQRIPGHKEQLVHWTPTPFASLSKSSVRYCGCREQPFSKEMNFETGRCPKDPKQPISIPCPWSVSNVLTLVFREHHGPYDGHGTTKLLCHLNQWHPWPGCSRWPGCPRGILKVPREGFRVSPPSTPFPCDQLIPPIPSAHCALLLRCNLGMAALT